MNGNIATEATNPDTKAGVAYAKIRAVYPKLNREMIAKSSVEELMNDRDVKKVLVS